MPYWKILFLWIFTILSGNNADLKRILDEHNKKITSIIKGFKLLGKAQFKGEK